MLSTRDQQILHAILYCRPCHLSVQVSRLLVSNPNSQWNVALGYSAASLALPCLDCRETFEINYFFCEVQTTAIAISSSYYFNYKYNRKENRQKDSRGLLFAFQQPSIKTFTVIFLSFKKKRAYNGNKTGWYIKLKVLNKSTKSSKAITVSSNIVIV